MSKVTLCVVAALIISTAAALDGQDGRIVNQKQLLSDYDAKRQQIIDARSPIKWPEKLNRRTPILILHGTRDWSALAEGSLEMAAALLKLKHPFRLVMLEGAGTIS